MLPEYGSCDPMEGLRCQDTGMKMFNFSRDFAGRYSAIFLLESEYTGVKNGNFELIILFHFVDQNICYMDANTF